VVSGKGWSRRGRGRDGPCALGTGMATRKSVKPINNCKHHGTETFNPSRGAAAAEEPSSSCLQPCTSVLKRASPSWHAPRAITDSPVRWRRSAVSQGPWVQPPPGSHQAVGVSHRLAPPRPAPQPSSWPSTRPLAPTSRGPGAASRLVSASRP